MRNHWPTRLLRAYGAEPWFIDPRRAAQMIEALALRAEMGPMPVSANHEPGHSAQTKGAIAVLSLNGTIAPRISGMDAMSGNFVGLDQFQRSFAEAAQREDLSAIVLSVDSPGGQVDLVPETAEMIYEARREGRPIVAVANTLAASAAYWIASAADHVAVTPSGEVGSIGVFTVHEDVSQALEAEGVKVSIIRAGSRKIESNPFEPLTDEARAAVQQRVSAFYDMFVGSVAKHRGVDPAVVRADPEDGGAHMGAGRTYDAKTAVSLGMADSIETLDQVITRLSSGRTGPSALARKRRLSLT